VERIAYKGIVVATETPQSNNSNRNAACETMTNARHKRLIDANNNYATILYKRIPITHKHDHKQLHESFFRLPFVPSRILYKQTKTTSLDLQTLGQPGYPSLQLVAAPVHHNTGIHVFCHPFIASCQIATNHYKPHPHAPISPPTTAKTWINRLMGLAMQNQSQNQLLIWNKQQMPYQQYHHEYLEMEIAQALTETRLTTDH
jgi:hypothetical protein